MNRFFIWAHNEYSEMIDEKKDVDTDKLFQMMLDLTNPKITEKQFCDIYRRGKQTYKEFHEGMDKNKLPFSKTDVENQIRLIQNYFAQETQIFPKQIDLDDEYLDEEEEEEEAFLESEEQITKESTQTAEIKIPKVPETIKDESFLQNIKDSFDGILDIFIGEEEEEEEEEEFNEIDELVEEEYIYDNLKFEEEEIQQLEYVNQLVDEEILQEDEKNEEKNKKFKNIDKLIDNEILREKEEEDLGDDNIEEEDLDEDEEEEEEEDDDIIEIEYFENDSGKHDIIVPQYVKKMCQKYVPRQTIEIDKKINQPPEEIEIEFYKKVNSDPKMIVIPSEIKQASKTHISKQPIDIELSFDLEVQTTTENVLKHENDGKLHLYALNVGYGNLTILSIGTKAVILDAGSTELTDEMEKDNSFIPNPFVIPAATILKTKKVEIAIITHPTKDHFNLLKAVLENSGHDLSKIQFICGGYENQYEEFKYNNRQFSIDLDDLDQETMLCKKQEFESMLNDFFSSEKVYFNLLLPIRFNENPSRCKNSDYSNLILAVDYRGKRVLIPGDSTSKTIKSISYSDSLFLNNVDIFIVPNHGIYNQFIMPLTIKSKFAIISSDPKFYKCSLNESPNSKYISKLADVFDSKAPPHQLLAYDSKSKNKPIELKTEAPIFSVSNNYFKYSNFCFNGIHLSFYEENEIEFEYRKPKIQVSDEIIQLK